MGISAGMDSLSEKSRLQRLRSRHRDFYLALADEAEEGLRGPDQKKWRGIVENEYDNFLQALQWSLETADADSSLRLAVAVHRVLSLRGDDQAAAPWLRKALALPAPPSASRVKPLILLAQAVRQIGGTQEALELRQEAVEVARACGDRRAEVQALAALGGNAMIDPLPLSGGGLARGEDLVEEALRIADEIGDEHGLAEAAWRLSSHRFHNGKVDEGRALSRRALELYRKLGDIENVGWMTYGDAWREEDPVRAKQLALEALDMSREIGDTVLLSCSFEALVFIEEEAVGDIAAARRWTHQWEEELRAITPRLPWSQEAWVLIDSAYLDIDQGRWYDARRRCQSAISLVDKSGFLLDERYVRLALGRVYVELENYELAQREVLRSVEISRDTGVLLGQSLYSAAIVAMAGGDLEFAREFAQEAVQVANPRWTADVSRELLVEIALEEGDVATAKHQLKALLETDIEPFAGHVQPSRRGILRAKVARHLGNFEESHELINSAASELIRLQHRILFSAALEEAAALHQSRGESVTGAKILGAAQALRTRIEYPVPQRSRRSYERLVEEVRHSLGESAFGEALRAGAGRSEQEALELLQPPARVPT